MEALADCLIGYYDGRAQEEVLNLHAKIHREVLKFRGPSLDQEHEAIELPGSRMIVGG